MEAGSTTSSLPENSKGNKGFIIAVVAILFFLVIATVSNCIVSLIVLSRVNDRPNFTTMMQNGIAPSFRRAQ